MAASDGNVTYAFGGDSMDAPLIRRTVPFRAPPQDPGDLPGLQAYLLERADAVLEDLWAVFDDALETLDAALQGPLDPSGALLDPVDVAVHCLNVAMGALQYATTLLMGPCQNAKYGAAFVRLQELMRRLGDVRELLGPEAVQGIRATLDPLWRLLVEADVDAGAALRGTGATATGQEL
jgi:hypothetical protein